MTPSDTQWYVPVVRPHVSLLEHETVVPVTVTAAGAASAEDVDVTADAFAAVAVTVADSELRVVTDAVSLAAVFAAGVETAVADAAWMTSVAAAVEAPGAALAGDVDDPVDAAAVDRASVVCRPMAVWTLPKSAFRKSSATAPPDVVSTVTSTSTPVSMVTVDVYGPWPLTKTRLSIEPVTAVRTPVNPNTEVMVTKDLKTVTVVDGVPVMS